MPVETNEQAQAAERWVAPDCIDTREEQPECGVRPRRFSDLVGQADLVANLKVFVQAALERKEALDHLLLAGPPGLGKTTLAHIVAQELGVDIHVTSGPAIERKDLAGIVSHLKERDVLFIDEIHRLPAVVEENLYPAMEDYKFDLVLGDGPHARSIEMPLPRFTLIGATTRSGLLTGPMRDRFGFTGRLQYYGVDELRQVVQRTARVLGIACAPEGAQEIARRARGTPRIANRLLRRVRDFAEVQGKQQIGREVAAYALQRLGVDDSGLDMMDRLYLEALIHMYAGGPAGLEALASAVAEQADTLEEVYEPYLIQRGFVVRTPRGRQATRRGYEHLGVPVPAQLER